MGWGGVASFESVHLDQQRPDLQERTSTSYSEDCKGASIGASFDTGDVSGASLIVSPSTTFEFGAIRGPAAELNGTLNGTRNCVVFLSMIAPPVVSLTKRANLGMGWNSTNGN